MLALKSHLVIRMLENRIGPEQLLQALNKLLSLATNGSVSKQPQNWSNMVCCPDNIFLIFENNYLSAKFHF